MSKGLCDLINTVDKYVVDDPNNPGEYNSEHLLSIAFPKKDCDSDDQKLTSSFIALLTLLNDNKNENLEGDKLVEYAILWLSYKLNQKKKNRTIIFNEFYTKDIEKNSCYNQKITDNSDKKINKDVIKNKIKSMDIDIKDISNFYDAFKSLCNMYNEIVADDDQCNKCLESAGEFDNNYQFKDKNFLDSYCDSNKCESDFQRIDGGCLYLFNQIFGTSEFFKSVANSNINIVDYILIWLSYMLSLKEQVGISNLQYFYNTTIDNDRYKKTITGVENYYENYKYLIDKKKYFLGMDKKIISNFYEAFKLLCEMHAEFDDTSSYCANCSKNASNFVNKYKEMNENSDITNNGSYNKLLSTLSEDYDNFINKYNNNQHFKSSPLPTIEEIKTSAHKILQSSEDTSTSSSVTNKLFTVLSIFGVIAFLLGISYKYSLFGFRKRFQKQKLREKVKNIKKRMNH
ncbi:hypothetical protein YYC_02374 [Plasmodium yoelii 17X]|uniref:YIR protein n=1 Tax=Plasmodium yoelii 17X TaxID=1323249 RepID=V7PLT2_PLAYE|nr:hypothetical protein YYC_02374 [Plasmodium yoelii 17X]